MLLKNNYSFFVFFIIILFSQKCANPSAPTGGPKDTIPPTFLYAEPKQQSINFNSDEITFYFDEYITTDQLQSNLIIIPSSELKYKSKVKKNRLILKLESELEDSTTYTFNFFESITDITERTPAENFIYAFSTGSFIDSVEVMGTVRELLNQKPIAQATVGLYPVNDTLDFFSDKPTYFIRTDEEGKFFIQNIKRGYYRILSFKDENKNLLPDPSKESYGFLEDTIALIDNSDSLDLYHIQKDARPIRLISGRKDKTTYLLRYNKEVYNYEVHFTDSLYEDILFPVLSEDQLSVKIFSKLERIDFDSLQAFLEIKDTLSQVSQDTIFLKIDTTADKYEFQYTVQNKAGKEFGSELALKILFNKPISSIDTTSLKFIADTVYTQEIRTCLQLYLSLER
jgi:hypothetical protein